MNYWSKRMALNPGYLLESPEAFHKNITTQGPLPESDFIDVNQGPGTGDSRILQGKNYCSWVL